MTARSLSTWLTAEIDEADGGVHVALQGSIDSASTAPLRKLLRSLSDKMVTIDLSEMTFIDTDGVTVLLAARQVAERLGGGLALTAIPEHRRYLLELHGAGCLLEEDPPAPGQHRRRFANRPDAVDAVRGYVGEQLAAESASVRERAVVVAAELARHAVAHTDADFAVLLEHDENLGIRVEVASTEGPSVRGSALSGITRRVLPLRAPGEHLTSLKGR